MTDSSANLSVDFLVGFTIFMVAFIWVATLIPNLFLGVSAHGIDFDAVAYRSGVILAEDPGQSVTGEPWEVLPDTANASVQRFGLAVSKNTPNVLSEEKVNRFFNFSDPPKGHFGPFVYPDDYRQKVIFGDYPYSFNISMQVVGEGNTRYIGAVRPDNYGFIRREVKIKHSASNATLEYATDYRKYRLNNTQNSTYHNFAILINTTELLWGNITNPLVNPIWHEAYQINPQTDAITIVLNDLDVPVYDTRHALYPGELNVTEVKFYNYGLTPGMEEKAGPPFNTNTYIYKDSDTTPSLPPFGLRQCLTFVFEPGFFLDMTPDKTDMSAIYINVTFHIPANDTFPNGKPFLNTSGGRPFDYNYNETDVTQPYLKDAVMEVAVW